MVSGIADKDNDELPGRALPRPCLYSKGILPQLVAEC